MMGEGAGSKGASWRRGSKAAEWQTAWKDGGLAGAARKDGGLARTSQQRQTQASMYSTEGKELPLIPVFATAEALFMSSVW